MTSSDATVKNGDVSQAATNPNRHSAQCSICSSDDKAAIEAAYKAYRPVDDIASDFDVSRDAVYRHCGKDGPYPQLHESRERNIGGIANWILEKGQKADIEVTPALMAAAMTTSAKIHGLFIDRTMDVTKSLETASYAALEFYRSHGRLPTAVEEAALPSETEQ